MSVSKRLRYEILRRDEYACRYCGGHAPAVRLTIDHVVPVALGGADEASNLVAACADCNAGKTSASPDQSLVAQVSDDAFRWARAMALAAQRAADQRNERWAALTEFDELWQSFFAGAKTVGDHFRPPSWEASWRRFTEAGLTAPDLLEIAHSALSNERVRSDGVWRYFCGAAWGIVRERQHEAQRLVAAEDS